MSKAWVNENARDAAADDDDGPDDPRPLPPGQKNHITPEGFERMRGELNQLLRVERPKVVEIVHWAAGNGDRSENGDYIYGKKRLREIDRRMRFLSKRLEIANVVDPSQQKHRDQVFFGATVTYAREDGTENTVTIVGVDETDMGPGRISWVSPVARALLKAREGDLVSLRTPAGVEELEVVSILYPPPAARVSDVG
ncbi:transcription elongation factor GreB [Niveispirillum sp.]|uniref:transcription elongation factor GreB n=1 Tax=Niveispirillum sp. TaxID=1917217 RepID=UPI001B4ADF59|nr:transcription elongation factor GreB [Niveispirillum sp.]MBP7334423.1 transcription elongation factor GreB [Niveispirillum sp.]